MSKRPSLLGHCSGRAAKRPAQQRKQQQYLYLVLNDWERGVQSIYRLGEDDFDSDFDADADADLEARPAESPLVRIEANHPFSWCFAAHGAKIFAMHPPVASPGMPVFDTETYRG